MIFELHKLEIRHVRTELVEHSHGRESAHAVEELVCNKCGILVADKHYGFGSNFREVALELRLRTLEHNLFILATR